jgi:hypothetical protein
VGQAYISKRQTYAAQEGLRFTEQLLQIEQRQAALLSPRLRVADVRAVNLEIGRWPAFIVTVANEGATDARDVTVQLRLDVDYGAGNRPVDQGSQSVTIVAHDKRAFDLQLGVTLEADNIQNFMQTVRVLVSLRHETLESNEFCFKYHPWKMGERPKEIAQFIPCDSNAALAYTMPTGPAGQFKITP